MTFRPPLRKVLLGATVLAVAGTTVVAGAQFASAASIDTSATYVFVNRHSGKAMDLYGWSTSDGAAVNQYARNDLAVQQWKFVSVGSGYYQIKSVHSGKVLEMPNSNDGQQLVQYTASSGNTRQQFSIKDSSASGYVRFVNRSSGKALDIWEWSTADGAKIAQYQDLDGANQQWTLTKLGSSNGSGSGGLTMRGGDVSSLRRGLETGARYYNASGVESDPLDIMKSAGMNYARLRVWNNPASGYNNMSKVLLDAQKIKSKGLALMVDFHYSDTWADPGNQNKPAAWSSHNLSTLQSDVYNFTYQSCMALKNQGTTPDSIQVGNEINVGMLWNEGKVINNDFSNLSSLLKSGYNAVKACNSGTKVIIHTANADNVDHARWFYDGIKGKGVQWDITGLSYYCAWHGTLDNLYYVIGDTKSRYGKPVVLVETGAAFTTANADSTSNTIPGGCNGYAATWSGQATNFTHVQNTARNAGAIGVFYWEPTWTATKGNGWDPANMNGTGTGWDNMAIFDWNGRVNPDIAWKQ